MKKFIRTSLLIIVLGAALFVGKNKWIKFRDNTDSDRYSQPSYRKTTDFFRKVLGIIPRADAHHALADSYLDEGLEKQAIEEYKKTLQMDEHCAEAYVSLAGIYLRGSYKEAMELLDKAEGMIPENPEIKDLKKKASYSYFLQEGMKAFEKGGPLKARALLDEALKADPNSAQVNYLIALSLDERQDSDRVEEYLKKTLSLDPKFYLARSFLGDVYFGRGNFEAAIEQYKIFLEAKGDDPSVFNNTGLAYMNLEKYGLAIPFLQKALAFDPLNVETRHNLSAVYRDSGMLDKAAEGFHSIIAMKPDYPNVHNDLGDIYRGQGRDQQALKEYRATIEYGNKKLSTSLRDPLVLVELAYAYNQVQEFDEAKKLIDEALRLDPRDPKAYWTLASIYRSSNRPEAALTVLERAKKISSKKYRFIEETIEDIKKQMALSNR